MKSLSFWTPLALSVGAISAHASLVGPVYPAPGGNGWGGSGGMGEYGGASWTYTINNPAQYSQLYWGPWNSPNAVASALDGSLDNMALSWYSANQAQWFGTTSYPNHPGDNPGPGTYQTRFTLTLSSGATFVSGASVGRSDVPVLANITGLSSFGANLLFEASGPYGWVPIAADGSGSGYFDNYTGYTQTSFSGGFYSAPVPEPSTYVAGALMLLPFGVSFVRKLRNRR